jgi:hypothetical protein
MAKFLHDKHLHNDTLVDIVEIANSVGSALLQSFEMIKEVGALTRQRSIKT